MGGACMCAVAHAAGVEAENASPAPPSHWKKLLIASTRYNKPRPTSQPPHQLEVCQLSCQVGAPPLQLQHPGSLGRQLGAQPARLNLVGVSGAGAARRHGLRGDAGRGL